ncbi:Protein PFC0760c-like [Caenorhabditis elegans]|uniref:Protein PFC0760c-like n=1 Tax=Caenorhabditis elegans TaxID=6239 RepID=G5EBU8_CAEEL|nr:Protein PFC0760c-like [Caenorhabditis elegans]CAB03350.3 Protein PFC0760c-like [Caenorhabditis elegans]|eukprot:NP_001022758.1 Uncharacterized protein CELE_T12D8.9 [Caenorhabditis elegans]
MPTYYYPIFILLLFLSTSWAGPTVLITGPSWNNLAKFNVLLDFVPEDVVENNSFFNSNIVIFNEAYQDSMLSNSKVYEIDSVSLKNNVSTVVFVSDSAKEHDENLKAILRTERSLFVVEFGRNNQKPWQELADCWATSEIASTTQNKVYFCNKKSQEIPFEISTELILIQKPVVPKITSFFYASATKHRVDRKKVEEELEDEIQDIVEESMRTVERRKKHDNDDDDDDEDGNEFDNRHDPKRDHRLHCKYRKSCYESGKRGLIEPFDISFDHIFHFWRAPATQQHHLPITEDADQDGVPDSEDDDVTLADRKFVCKYRTSCYKDHNIPLSDKLQERERSFMSAKLQVPQGKKRTLKDIAKKAVSGVKEREEEAKARPVPKSLIVEKKLQEIENQLQKKLDCKYRKSCYETGQLPEIEESAFTSFSIPFLSKGSDNDDDDDDDDDDEKEQKPFEDMNDLEKKHHCKYRKSCYETGERPEIESELAFESFRDILEMPDKVETRKLTLQERCKYRKSCYKTGIIPDLSSDDEHIEKVIKKEVSSVVPSTVRDLKTLCKYRKSCYEEISESASVDIVQTIRKRRMIEKEVRKRRTRRHRRLHKRHAMMSRYGMTSGSASKYDKVEKTQKELQDIADAREHRKDAPAPKSVKLHGKKKAMKAAVEDVIEQKIVEAVAQQDVDDNDDESESEPEPEKNSNKKNSKRVKEPEPEPEEEPEPVKKSKRSLKKVKVAVPDPAPESKDEENEESVSEQEPESESEPEPAKKTKRSLKKVKEPEPEPEEYEQPTPVPVPVPVKMVIKKQEEPEPKSDLEENDNDDDEGTEFDNKHDPKRDHRLHCKYRKTCYESGNRGLIEPYDFSIWHIVHFWAAPPSQTHHNYGKHKDSDGDGVPDIEDKDAAMADRKLSCKYRPSCYEKYDIPVGEKILEREQKRTEASDSEEKDDDDDDNDDDVDDEVRKINLKAADRRLECKYRRSCYDSGVLPTIQQWSEAPTLTETIALGSKNAKMQKCKYRKSCYEAAGITDKDDDVKDNEERHLKEKLKPVESERHHHHHSKHGKKKHQEPEDEEDDDEEEKEEKQKNKEEKKEDAKIHEQTDKETIEQGVKDISLSAAEKSWCKYRKSCYSSVEPKAAKQDHSGTMARREGSGKKCHIYYLSCREAMGLPPKKKAPMGPNGKRLCRKVKKDD